MFDDNPPAGWKPCCELMLFAVLEERSVKVLGNYKHVICKGGRVTTLRHCPWCLTRLAGRNVMEVG